MRRVWIVGNSGAGKTTLGRAIAAALAVPHVELDAMFHQAGWVELERGRFREEVAAAVAGEAWVIDGNYSAVSDLVLERADTVVFLDLARGTVMRQVMGRTLRRVVLRQVLWNGNREPFSNLWRVDPKRSIIAWSWTEHAKYARRYRSLMAAPEWAHLAFHRVTSRRQASALVRDLACSVSVAGGVPGAESRGAGASP